MGDRVSPETCEQARQSPQSPWLGRKKQVKLTEAFIGVICENIIRVVEYRSQ